MEVALRVALKAYGEEGLAREKDLGQSVGAVTSTKKRKRGTGKGWEESIAPDKSGIERGDIPKGDDARVPVKVWNIREWGSRIIQEDPALDFMREGILR